MRYKIKVSAEFDFQDEDPDGTDYAPDEDTAIEEAANYLREYKPADFDWNAERTG